MLLLISPIDVSGKLIFPCCLRVSLKLAFLKDRFMVYPPKHVLLILYDMNFEHIVWSSDRLKFTVHRHILENEKDMTKG